MISYWWACGLLETEAQNWSDYSTNGIIHEFVGICQVYIISCTEQYHCDDVIMSAVASQITSLTIVYSTVFSDAGQRKHPSSASLVFVWGIHRWPVNSPHKWPAKGQMFHFQSAGKMELSDIFSNIQSTRKRIPSNWFLRLSNLFVHESPELNESIRLSSQCNCNR